MSPVTSIADLLLRLSQPSLTQLQEHRLKQQLILKRDDTDLKSQIFSFSGWHCLPHVCSLLRSLCKHSDCGVVTEFIARNASIVDIHCSTGRHCSCKVVLLMSQVKMRCELIPFLDKLIAGPVVGERNCLLDASLSLIDGYIDTITDARDTDDVMLLLKRMRPMLPKSGRNFVGQITPSYVSSSGRWFVTALLKLLKSRKNDCQWMKEQFLYLEATVASLSGFTEAGNSSTEGLIHIFEEDDMKLISVTNGMISILTEVSDTAAAHRIFHEFGRAIRFDYKVLIDWLTSEETAVDLLSLLLTYLKLGTDAISDDVKNMLTELRQSLVRLQAKNLIPYSTAPLIRQMQTL